MSTLRTTVLAATMALCAAAPAQAQIPLLDVRVGAHAVLPSGDLGDFYDTGFGIYGRVGAPMGPMKLMGSLTWNQFKGANAGIDDVSVITLQAGPHFGMALLDVGLELAYYSEFEEMGFSPNVSLNLLRFDVTMSYNTTFDSPQANWLTLGAGFRF